MTRIEDIYQELCNKKNNPLYFQTYAVVKSRLNKSYLPFIRDVQPFSTDHGIGHVDRILEKLSRFLDPHLPRLGNPEERIIDLENLNLLMHSVLWHDVGNLYGRLAHEQNVINIFNTIKDFLYDPVHQGLIVKIAKGHSGIDSIGREIEDGCHMVYDTATYPQFLSALLRISDELDEDQRRIEPRIFTRVQRESQAFWKFSSFNESIVPVYSRDSLGNESLEIQIFGKIPGSELYQKFGKNATEVVAIEDYIGRIDKMNSERVYCNKYLQQGSSIYFHAIDRIKSDICICDDHGNTMDKVVFIFQDNKGGTDFFSDPNVYKILKKYVK